MIVAYVWFFFLGGCAINVRWLAGLDLARLDFLDGILIGQAYYIIIPLFVFLVEGRTQMPDVSLVYRPYEDLGTTAMLTFGMYLFPALRIGFARVPAGSRDTSDPHMAAIVLLLFVASSAASFLLSGLAQGGHWQENLDGAFANPLFLPVKYTANVARNAMFAVLLYRVARGQTTVSRRAGTNR